MHAVAIASLPVDRVLGVPSPNPRAVSEYCRHLMQSWMLEHPGRHMRTEFADLLGVTRVAVHQLEKAQRGAGAKIESAFAKVFAAGSIDKLRADAVAWWGQQAQPPKGEHRVEYDTPDRYPNRAKAIRAAREVGMAEEAIVIVASIDRLGSDLPAITWLDQIRSQEQTLKHFSPVRPETEAEATARVAALKAEDQSEAAVRARARLADKKK